jgi:hypothetical protein
VDKSEEGKIIGRPKKNRELLIGRAGGTPSNEKTSPENLFDGNVAGKL